jgi:hypothetical protein
MLLAVLQSFNTAVEGMTRGNLFELPQRHNAVAVLAVFLGDRPSENGDTRMNCGCGSLHCLLCRRIAQLGITIAAVDANAVFDRYRYSPQLVWLTQFSCG